MPCFIYRESLCRLSKEIIDSLEITIGQKLLLKDAVMKLKNDVDYGKQNIPHFSCLVELI